MNTSSLYAEKMNSTWERLLKDVDFVYENLILAVNGDRISWQAASSLYNACAAAKPVINKYLSDLRTKGYSADLRRDMTSVHVPLERAKKYLLEALQSDATNP